MGFGEGELGMNWASMVVATGQWGVRLSRNAKLELGVR